jgi:hypothetical protein
MIINAGRVERSETRRINPRHRLNYCTKMKTNTKVVIPAEAGIQFNIWMPASAGMTISFSNSD